MNTFTEKRVIVLFSTAAGLRTYSFTKKGLHIGSILVKFVKFYWISFLQETARRLLLISSNISDISPALLAVNQLSLSWLSRTSRKSHSWKVSKYGDLLRIQYEYRKIRTRKNSVVGHFSRSELFTSNSVIDSKIFKMTKVEGKIFLWLRST